MTTFPTTGEQTGRTVAFEIDNIYVGLGTIARILSQVTSVNSVRVRRPFSGWKGIHVWFTFSGHNCVVCEPFGDNSRYWIGREDSKDAFDLSEVEQAFKRYQPPWYRDLLGSLLSLRFPRLLRRQVPRDAADMTKVE